jgi:hypothetical protein
VIQKTKKRKAINMNKQRNFWRVTIHSGESGDQVYDGLVWEVESREEAMEIAISAIKTKKQESATIENIQENILSEENVVEGAWNDSP